MSHVSAGPATGASALRRIALLLGLIGALGAFFALSASGAKAETVGFSLDRGVINLGGEEEGVWAPIIDPALGDPPASINAEVSESGVLSASADEFFFPPKRIEGLETGNGSLPVVDANIAITADGPLTGSFDAGTGEASIVLPADVFITVYPAGSPISVAKCRVDGFELTLATTGSISDPGDPTADPPRAAAVYDASPFVPPGSEGAEGATIASWAALPASQNEGGTLGGIVCPALDGMLGGPGAIWMAGETGGAVEIPVPGKQPKLTSTPATSTERTSAEFKFEKGEGETSPVTGFQCKLDAGAFADCSAGSQSYSDLGVGSHTFAVKAVNDMGAGPETTYTWTVTKAHGCPDGMMGTPPDCVKPPKKRAKLANLKVKPKHKTVRRGKKAVFKVKVRNRGNAAAKGVKVCVKAPKRLVKVKKCARVGRIKAGRAKTIKFKVKAKRRKGKATLRVKATSKNAGKKNARAKVRIK